MRFKGWLLFTLAHAFVAAVAWVEDWLVLLAAASFWVGVGVVMSLFGAAVDEDDPERWRG